MKRKSSKQLAGLLLLIWSTCLVILSLYMTHNLKKNLSSSVEDSSMILPRAKIRSSFSTPRGKRRFEPEARQSVLESIRRQKNTTQYTCSNLTSPDNGIPKDKWQTVDSDQIAYVFSAYQDENEVNVVGISLRTTGRLFTCQLWYRSNGSSSMHPVIVPASRKVLPEHHARRYTATYFTCRIPKDHDEGHIVAVSVTTSPCAKPSNVVPVTRNYNKEQANITYNFTVCVSPFNMNYARAYELIEWIELNRILGADRLIFYNFSIASNVDKVLQSYMGEGSVEVIDWKLPVKVPSWPPDGTTEEIHYFGQIVSLNDCLLRSRGRSEFVVNLDLDEFIIPRGEHVTTWHEMLNQIKFNTSIYIFANVFFRKEWDDSRTNFSGYEEAVKYRLVTLLRLQHEKRIWMHGQRSKYFVRPYSARVLGVHSVWSHTGSSQYVPHNVALLQHYRNLDNYADKQARIEDDEVVRKYKDTLLDNVKRKWKTLPDVVQDVSLCNQTRDFGVCS